MDDQALTAALEVVRRAAGNPSALIEPFLELFPVSGAAVSTVGALLGNETVSASDVTAARVDELQFDLGEGPCWDAMKSSRPVLEPDIHNNPRTVWPAFSAAIQHEQVGALFAFPLTLGPLQIGAVDLYSSLPVNLTTEQSQRAEVLAGAVGRQVLRRALDVPSDEREDLGNASLRRLVHQATGMVLAQLHITADDALLIIQGHAFAGGMTMMDVAQDVIDRRLVFSYSDSGIEAS